MGCLGNFTSVFVLLIIRLIELFLRPIAALSRGLTGLISRIFRPFTK